jgi:hypothetical protein
VRIYSYKGRIEVFSEKLYEERKQSSGTVTAEGLTKLQKAGLK